MNKTVKLILTKGIYARLQRHHFPGDDDEHGSVIKAGICETATEIRLLAREFLPAKDGEDYIPGTRGYRQLVPAFIRDRVLECRDERLAYLAVHNHPGDDYVAFSGTDLQSHERGYPALLDIVGKSGVGGLVFARNAVAGDLWLSGGRRLRVDRVIILGQNRIELADHPIIRSSGTREEYRRQTLLFGPNGQAILEGLRVGVIGLGGIGSLLAEYLARLGVGLLVLADPDRISMTNFPRVVGSRREDLATRAFKVAIAERLALEANPSIHVTAIPKSITDRATAEAFRDCDYLFLAADTMQARLVFNCLVHQYLIPGVQLGSKVRADHATGDILDVYSVVRPITPESGCLWCNGLIPPGRLQDEALTEDQRAAQRYVDDETIEVPSVITLNAVAAAHATNQFLMWATGLRRGEHSNFYTRFHSREGRMEVDEPRREISCPECGSLPLSRVARGDARALPVTE